MAAKAVLAWALMNSLLITMQFNVVLGVEVAVSCHMEVQLGPVWEVGNSTYASSVNMMLSNKGTAYIPPGHFVEVFNANYLGVESSWNWDITESVNGTVSGFVSQDWAFLMPLRGNKVTIGAIFLGSGPENFIPWGVGMNGTACTMQQM